jgi:hypothetical protein
VLAALAAAEVAAAAPDARLACADAWFDWAQKQKAKTRSAGLAHAADLYRRSLPGLTGLALARADKRLSEIEKLIGRVGPRYPDGAVLLLTFEPSTFDGSSAWDQGPHRHQARISGAKPSRGPWGGALEFAAAGATATVANHPSLQTAGSSTLMMWLKPEQLGARRNPWNKSYGGEGTWTIEADGLVNGYYGTAGIDGDPYTQLVMPKALAPAEWVHLALVRDLEAKLVTWYRDGMAVESAAAAYPAVKASPNDITIGAGYAGAYVGLIDEVALWPRALAAREVKTVFDATVAGRK